MSRADLADKLAVTEQTIYAWIKGKSKPTDEKLDALTEIFKAERAEVYFLAGKGYAGIEYDQLLPEFASIALRQQDAYLQLKSSAMRDWFFGLISRKLDEAITEVTALHKFQETLKKEGEK